jgi:hypothetical protein
MKWRKCGRCSGNYLPSRASHKDRCGVCSPLTSSRTRVVREVPLMWVQEIVDRPLYGLTRRLTGILDRS